MSIFNPNTTSQHHCELHRTIYFLPDDCQQFPAVLGVSVDTPPSTALKMMPIRGDGGPSVAQVSSVDSVRSSWSTRKGGRNGLTSDTTTVLHGRGKPWLWDFSVLCISGLALVIYSSIPIEFIRFREIRAKKFRLPGSITDARVFEGRMPTSLQVTTDFVASSRSPVHFFCRNMFFPTHCKPQLQLPMSHNYRESCGRYSSCT